MEVQQIHKKASQGGSFLAYVPNLLVATLQISGRPCVLIKPTCSMDIGTSAAASNELGQSKSYCGACMLLLRLGMQLSISS